MTDGGPTGEAESVGDAIVQVADDAKAYAAAQLALYRTIATSRWRFAQRGLLVGAVAAVLALAALGALLVGLILALATVVGPLGATAIVVVTTLVVAGILGWAASRSFAAAFGELE